MKTATFVYAPFNHWEENILNDFSDIHDIIYRVVYEFGIKLQAQKEYVSFLSHFFTLSLGAIVESWLNGELEQSPEELVNMIDLFVQDQLRGAEQRIFNHK